MKQPTPTGDLTTDVAHGLKYFPQFLVQWLFGLFLAVISDYAIFSFTVLAVLVGIATESVLYGAIVFLSAYVTLRIFAAHAEVMGGAVVRAASSVQLGLTNQRVHHQEIDPLSQAPAES
jgi:hypothetical protein